MSQSKSRLDIPWPNDTECMVLCPVPFVMRIPTILWCRVPSLPRWWLGVHIRPMYCTPLPATQEWKWTGLKWISKWEVRPPLPWFLTFRLSWGASQTLYWANPLKRWWRNASLWGVKVGVQNVAWWAVCHRRRLPLWGGVAVGAWMTLGAGHGPCILSEFGYQSQAFGTLVLVCRLLNTTNKPTNMSMSGQNLKSPSCSPSTPNNTESPDADPDTLSTTIPRKTFPRFLVVEGLDPNKSLTRVNRTILTKTIDGTTSESVKREWMGRALLVEVNHEAYSTNLLKLDKIGDMPVRVSAHRSLNYSKGVVRFKQAATDLTNEDMARDLNTSQRNRDIPQVREASRVIINKDGKKVQTGTFFLTFDAPTLPKYVFLGFERFDVELFIPAPRRCFKCQRFGHGARTCRATEDVCPMCSGTDHTRNECPNKDSKKCPNCDGAHSAASKECPAFITEQEALRIQAEKRCPLPDARKQAGQPVTAEQAANSYAQVTANSQANLVNRNLALSDENARLKEVINTLRQDNASLQQRLVSCEYRLQTFREGLDGWCPPRHLYRRCQKHHFCGKCPQPKHCGRCPHTPCLCGKCPQNHPCGRCPQTSCPKGPHGLTDRFWRHSWSTCQHASSPNRQDWGS